MAKTTLDINGVKVTIEGEAQVTIGDATVKVGGGSKSSKRVPHRGPFQEWTEVCLACGRNSYESPSCDPE